MTSPLAAALSMQEPIMQRPTSTIGNTDVVGSYRNATDAAMQAYAAQLQQQNAMWGGLAGLGGAAMLGGPAWAKMLGGGAGAGAAGAGTDALSSSLASSLGLGAGDVSLAGMSTDELMAAILPMLAVV